MRDLSIEIDSLHMLPLAMIPLRTPSLKRARLIKNAHLVGVVELFSNEVSGSGQIYPIDLPKTFDFSGEKRRDLDIVQSLSTLGSYDVYSLRIHLRDLGIDVDREEALRLSPETEEALSRYMTVFTRPLVKAIYGDSARDDLSVQDLFQIFADPDVEAVRRRLREIAESLGVNIENIPSFLHDYGDVYLSISYYRNCLDHVKPAIADILRWVRELERGVEKSINGSSIKMCFAIGNRLKGISGDVDCVLDTFETRTGDMWTEISGERFQQMKTLVRECQSDIGTRLCAMMVKTNAWHDTFPTPRAGSPRRRAEFILSELPTGLDSLTPIRHADL